ncbi:MAG: hypothetical protein HQM08_06945 [Candidatus Riflebacteria bacterium]|nr:hypothetical protein [Candidatus Riflebacteria bacterium]
MVLAVGTMILLPTIDFLINSQKTATKGFEKLEMLKTARLILETVQRDLKALCSGESYSFVPISTPTVSFSFPVFPTGATGKDYSGDENPVNIVTYAFEPNKKTLTRTIKIHPILANPGQSQIFQVLGTNIASFSICPKEMLKMRYYDVEIACQSSNPLIKESPIILRTAVRSDYESRLQRHPFLITNRKSKISFPP